MTGEATSSWLETWCDLTSAAATRPGLNLFSEVNGSWQAARPDAPASLLQALAKDEERRLALLVDQQVGHPAPTAVAPRVAPVVSQLHRVFVTEFDPVSERAACRADLSMVMSAGNDAELLDALARLTRAGYASPLHLNARATRGAGATVVPAIHASPLPPADFRSDERVEAYIRHMSAMVRYIGGFLSDDRLTRVVALDRALWVGPPADDPSIEFPWAAFLERAVGTRTNRWSSQVGSSTRRRMAAWWSGTVGQKRDWMISRLAYDLGPFASEEALVRNSKFFAGRVLGVTRPRSRDARFVSFVKTVAPDSLAELYVEDRNNPATLQRAQGVVQALRSQAIAWASSLGGRSGAWDGTRLLRDLVVELGHQPGAGELGSSAARDAERSIGSSVCHAIKAARTATVARHLALIDDPQRDAEWRIAPFTAAAYYQGSSNKVVVPWALLREPVLAPDLTDAQVYALFGTLVAHEMAHAVLPTSAAGWAGFVARASLGDVLDRFAAGTRSIPGYEFKSSHARELAADAIGFLWAHRAFRSHGAARHGTVITAAAGEEQLDPQFLLYWATRWRGGRPTSRDGFGHIDHHPPAELRCNVAPTYAGRVHDAITGTAGELTACPPPEADWVEGIPMSWEEDLESAWQELPSLPPHEFLSRITKIVEDPAVPPEVRDFQVACAHDSTGRSDLAVTGYRRALDAGLSGYSGRRAKIQLASSLRNLGQPQESVRILLSEPASVGDGLDDAVVVFLGLALADVGRDREAVARLVHALADHLPRYTASAHRYAAALYPSCADQAARPSQEGTDR